MVGYSKEEQREYYAKNIIARRKWKREWYKKNSEKVIRKNAIYQHNNLDKKRVYAKKRRRTQRELVLKHYSGNQLKCKICNYNEDSRALCIDHIDNNGSKHRKETGGGGERTYNWLINNDYPSGFQVLCQNCNWLKEMDNRQYFSI
jgi:hypothetical protein